MPNIRIRAYGNVTVTDKESGVEIFNANKQKLMADIAELLIDKGYAPDDFTHELADTILREMESIEAQHVDPE